MSLQFLIGPQTADKRKVYIEEMKALMTEKPNATFFVIVPEHAKFEGEMNILEQLWQAEEKANPNFMGSINLQVFSFSRLAWFFLRDQPIFQYRQLSDAGISMLLRKILLDKADDLILFRREIDKEGFIQQLTDLFKELRAGRIQVADLEVALHQGDESIRQADRQLKLKELAMIYEVYCQKMDEGYLQYEMLLEALAEMVEQSDMTDVYLYIEGYYYFSAQELQILHSFLHHAEKVTLVLDLDKPYVERVPELHDLFYAAGSTYFNLYQYARSHGIPVLQDKRIVTQVDGYQEGMVSLDHYWIQTTSGTKQSSLDYELAPVQELMEVWACDTKQAEIFHVANNINRLVQEKGYRYKDFLILARRVEDYETILSPLFNKANLSVFYDKAEEMRHHPFTDFIDSLFRIRMNYWRYPDIMRLLRTELLVPAMEMEADLASKQTWLDQYRDKVDQTENILLGYGFEGNAWFEKDDWQVYDFGDEEDGLNQTPEVKGLAEANIIKRFLQETLLPYYRGLPKIKTGRDAALALYRFLERNRINEQIIFWRDEALEAGNLDRARQHEQVWKTFTLLLDEYVETLGDMPYDEQVFHEILMTGFETATYSIVPPTLDQVIFSSIEGARFEPAKVVYIIGATQDQLPKAHENRSLLTEEERASLQQSLGEEGKYLRPSIDQSTASEPYIAYQAFLAGKEKLVVTYPMSSEEQSRVAKLSPYVARIAKDFDIPIQHRAANVIDAEKTANFMGTKIQNVAQLVKLLRHQLTSNEKMPLLWRKILSYVYRDQDIQPAMASIFASLKYKNVPAQLTPEIATELYGKNLYLSVSQLESYYLDSYSHFLKYGLRLKERQKYELSAAGTGEFYHEALEHIVRQMRGRKDLSKEEVQQIAENVLKNLFGSQKYAILSSSNRMRFIQEQLQDTIYRLSWVIQGQRSLTTFENLRTEAIFGQAGVPNALEGLEFPLSGGKSLSIRGKIDRIDKVEQDGKQYLTVMDYKSSRHTFQFEDAYYGLAMQMITYLDVAMMNAEQLMVNQAVPAGAFYLHVKNPFLEVLQQPSADLFEQKLIEENKWKGLIVADRTITDAMDPHVTDGASSLVLPFRYTNKGEFYSSLNDLVTQEELNLLMKNNRRRIQEAGERILSGELQMNPVKDRLYIPSVQGPYRAVSQFDSTLRENRYRRLEKMNKKQVLERLKEELLLKETEEEEEE
ncbi:PD-(D/E)XK nuclease family protein [Jeotgalibaca caeni]|uniref:PD-(D/E)XK nuclease family protein n=1 Tax=Jeotgalibaca caeni TaxID=3028623 RepID=UPI00237E44AB|nr:PD-(D/E)XK nuclease family protein [Jeotgalibaca caeni]MDE1548785.1 PD-(D/E)XK nuclease family protein [Jeotgalibaca caeni]